MAGRRITGITIEIDGNTTKLQQSLKAVDAQLKTTQSALRDVNRLLKLDPKNTELLRQKQTLLTKSIQDTSDRLKQLREADKQAKQQLADGKMSQEAYDALQREIADTEQQLKKLQEQAINSNQTLAKIEEVGDKMQNVGNKISGVGEKLLPVTAGVTALGTTAVKTTADFDKSLSQVQATMGIASDSMSQLNGSSVNTMDALRDLAKQMGESTAFSASECADAMNYLALAGYDTQDIYDTLPTVLNLAAAGNIDLASASDMVTDAMSALGMETSEADTMVDQMAKTSSSTNTSVEQLGEGILKIGATARSVKGGTAELNTALGILANNGIKGAEGGTSLRNIIMSLQNPTDTAAKAIEQLGVQVYDSEGNMRSMNDILGDFNASMDGMSQQDRDNIIAKIFNKTDLAAVNGLLANTGDTWDELQSSITNSAGSAQQMADTQLDNLSGQLTLLKSALEGLAISFGEVLMPVVKSAVDKIQGFVDKLNGMSDAQKETAVKALALAAALGPFLIAIGKTISNIGSAMKGFSLLTKNIAKLGLKLAGNNVAITGLGGALKAVIGPVMGVAAVVGVLVAAFVHLWNTNEDFRNTIIGIWDRIKQAATDFADGIKERIGSLDIPFEQITTTIKSIWDGFCNVLAPVFETAFSTIATIIETVFNVILAVLDTFTAAFNGDWEGFWNGIINIIGSILGGMIEIVSGIMAGLKDAVSAALEPLSAVVSGIWNGIVSAIVSVLSTVQNAVTAAWTVIQNITQGVFTAVAGIFQTVWNTISSVVSSTVSTVSSVVSSGFSKVASTVTSIMNSVKLVFTSAWAGIKTAASSAINGIKSVVSGGMNQMKTAVSNPLNAIKSLFSRVWDNCVSTVTGAVSRLKGAMNFSWSLPKIKLPHVSISGKFSLNPPSVPSFGIQWYKKAMDNGIIMNSPTIFGMDGAGNLMAGGEAGSETVVGTQSLMDMIQKAVSGKPATNISYTQNNYSPKELSRLDIYRNTRSQLRQLKGQLT